MMTISHQGLTFVERHEGWVSKAYRDPVGVITIGTGFTNRSATIRKHYGTIKLGDTITRERNRDLLRLAFEEEYGPPVDKKLVHPSRKTKQTELDCGYSVTFNLGPRNLEWKWAAAFRKGAVAEAAALLRNTGTTASGRKLAGLVRRRKEEADLLLNGNYGDGEYPTYNPRKTKEVGASPDPILADYQEKLRNLGYYKGQADGLRGPLTKQATEAFQKDHPQLVVDGILGRATQAQIDRVVDLRRKAGTYPTVAGGVTGVGGGVVETQVDAGAHISSIVGWGLLAALAVALLITGWLIYRYKDEVLILLKSLNPRS